MLLHDIDSPKEEEEVLRPEELLKQYHEKRTALDAMEISVQSMENKLLRRLRNNYKESMERKDLIKVPSLG